MTEATEAPVRRSTRTTKTDILRAEESLRRQVAACQLIGTLAEQLAGGSPFEQVLDETVRGMAVAFDLDMVCVLLLRQDASALEVASSVGLPRTAHKPIPVASGESLAKLAEAGYHILMREQDGDAPRGGYSLCIPLSYCLTSIGILCIGRATKHPPLQEGELTALRHIGAQIALGSFFLRHLHALALANETEKDIRYAHALKSEMLPTDIPDPEHFRFRLRTLRCLEGRGDFYDTVQDCDGHTLFIVGETSGRGSRAALNVAHLQTTLRGLLLATPDTAAALQDLNSCILEHGGRGQLVSLSVIQLHPATRIARIWRAGHARILQRINGTWLQPQTDPGTPLGILSSVRIPVMEITMRPGDVLIQFTDGGDRPDSTTPKRDNLIAHLNQDTITDRHRHADSLADYFLRDRHHPMSDDDLTLASLECIA